MADDRLDWVIIKSDLNNKSIGALGFYGDRVAVVTAFYDDADANEDGKVSIGERIVSLISPISLKGREVTTVAMAARNDPGIISRDQSFYTEAARMFVAFATNLTFDGFYAVYFSRAIGQISSTVAAGAVDGLVKQFVVRKGIESIVKRLYDSAVKQQTAFTGR
jgi:hypothetical protein